MKSKRSTNKNKNNWWVENKEKVFEYFYNETQKRAGAFSSK